MLDKLYHWVHFAVYAVITLAIGATIIFMITMVPGLGSGTAAAWVQAVGSIGAILATWLITAHQIGQQDKVRRAVESAAATDLAIACLTLATDTCIVLSAVHTKFCDPRISRLGIGTERLEELQFSLRALADKNLPAQLYVFILPLQREVAYTITAVRQQNKQRRSANSDRIGKALERKNSVLESKEGIAKTAARLQSKAAEFAD